MKAWLFDAVKQLKSVEVHTSKDNGRRMCSVLVIMDILFKISDRVTHNSISSDDIALLFSMLHLRPENVNQNIPPDLNFIMAFIPDQCYPGVAKVLVHFTTILQQAKLEWIYVIPLIHIFEKKVLPCAKPEVKSDLIKWTDVHFKRTRSTTSVMSW